MELSEALEYIKNFTGESLTSRISIIENSLLRQNKIQINTFLQNQSIENVLINAGFLLKNISGQINVFIHSVGILLTLPQILKDNEIIESLSLGAGNTGKKFDLETSLRVAEFKFINWQGGSESIRQNSIFKDFYFLAESECHKQKELYLVGTEIPLRFFTGKRKIKSVLSQNNRLFANFKEKYNDRFDVVKDYFDEKKSQVKLIDLTKIISGINIT